MIRPPPRSKRTDTLFPYTTLFRTEAEAAARRWAVARLQSMGFANVRDEPFDMSVWVRGEEEAWLTSPFLPQKLAITALGTSASTGPKGLEGDVAYFESFEDRKGGLEGKIVAGRVEHGGGR